MTQVLNCALHRHVREGFLFKKPKVLGVSISEVSALEPGYMLRTESRLGDWIQPQLRGACMGTCDAGP